MYSDSVDAFMLLLQVMLCNDQLFTCLAGDAVFRDCSTSTFYLKLAAEFWHSLLGPFLFILYIDDITHVVKNSSVKFFCLILN